MSDCAEYPLPPNFEGTVLEKAVAQGRICKNCVFWGPNVNPSGDWDYSSARCYGKEMNDYSCDHIPNTEPNDACGDFRSVHKKLWYRVSFATIAAYVEAVGPAAAVAKARGLCGQKTDTPRTWEVIEDNGEE